MAKTLSEILQTYFGCKVPFRKNGEFTTSGEKAYEKLTNLLDDLQDLKVIKSSASCMKVLDEIAETKPDAVDDSELGKAIAYVKENIDEDDLACIKAEANKCWKQHLVPTENLIDCEAITDLLEEYGQENDLDERWWEEYAVIDEIICKL
jgi:hypothetical protein